MKQIRVVLGVLAFTVLFSAPSFGDDCDRLRERIQNNYEQCTQDCDNQGSLAVSGLQDISDSLSCNNDCTARYPYMGATPQETMRNTQMRMQCQNGCTSKTQNLNNTISDRNSCSSRCESTKARQERDLEGMCN